MSDVCEGASGFNTEFEGATLLNELKKAVEAAVSCQNNCQANPKVTIEKIREGIYKLSNDEKIDAGESARLTARLMDAAGESYGTRQEVVRQLKEGDYSSLRL